MIFRVFADQAALNVANAAWAAAREADGVFDVLRGQPLDPGITCAWDSGRQLLDGRIACSVPGRWAEAFGGSEEELEEGDFVQPDQGEF